MRADLRRCAQGQETHDEPIYTLGETCPECGGPTENTAPAPFDPEDAYGEYRRSLKRRRWD